MIDAKKVEYSSRKNTDLELHTPKGGEIFVKAHSMKLQNIVSNLVNNAYDAIDDSQKMGKIELSIEVDVDEVRLLISDNGCGFPESIKQKLFSKGATFNKSGGTGMGLFHAKQWVQSWGGDIALSSIGKGGAIAILTLPREQVPSWYVGQVLVPKSAPVVVVDDEPLVHTLWDRLLVKQDVQPDQIVHLSSIDDFEAWLALNEQKKKNAFYFVDYEYKGQSLNGADFVRNHGLESNSVVVTGMNLETVHHVFQQTSLKCIQKSQLRNWC